MADRDVCPPRKEVKKGLEKIKNATKEPEYPPPIKRKSTTAGGVATGIAGVGECQNFHGEWYYVFSLAKAKELLNAGLLNCLFDRKINKCPIPANKNS